MGADNHRNGVCHIGHLRLAGALAMDITPQIYFAVLATLAMLGIWVGAR